jgi:hypothetical protein
LGDALEADTLRERDIDENQQFLLGCFDVKVDPTLRLIATPSRIARRHQTDQLWGVWGDWGFPP